MTGSIWPVLRFWDRYALADADDWVWLDVSTNGTSWTRLYATTLTRSTWAEQQIDLSPWKNATNLRIRFTAQLKQHRGRRWLVHRRLVGGRPLRLRHAPVL